jgi:hypothetical protein
VRPQSKVNKPWDLQFSRSIGKLVAVASYVLYSVDPDTGATARLATVV